jgi:hypothetical protein
MPGSRSVWGCLGAILGFILCLVVALAVWLSGWPNNQSPPLVAELVRRHQSGAPGNEQFNTELARRFPPGSPEESLRSELLREGFHHADGRNYVVTWSHFICTGEAAVSWTADRQGRIAALHGTYSHECG